MSEFKGTPGPWQRSPSKESGGSFIEHIDSDYVSHLVAFVHASHGMFEAPTPTEEDAANAHLIAAAPELLEALRLVREDIVVAGGHDSYCAYLLDKQDWRRDGAPPSERPPCNCWQSDALRKIDAAIAKALNTDTRGEGHE